MQGTIGKIKSTIKTTTTNDRNQNFDRTFTTRKINVGGLRKPTGQLLYESYREEKCQEIKAVASTVPGHDLEIWTH